MLTATACPCPRCASALSPACTRPTRTIASRGEVIGSITRNSSPPRRPTTSGCRHCSFRSRPTPRSSSSPAACPPLSLTSLKLSTSSRMIVVSSWCRVERASSGAEPLLQRAPVEQRGEFVGVGGGLQLLDQVRVLERDGRREGERAGQVELRRTVAVFVEPGPEQEDGQPLGAGVERDHQLGRRRRQRGHGDFPPARGAGARRQDGVEQGPDDRPRPDAVVERAEDPGLVGVPDRP